MKSILAGYQTGTRLFSDGRHITKLPVLGGVAIHRVDLKTHELSTLPGSEGFISPDPSPDGRYVAAMTTDSQKLMLFDFATRKWSELAQGNLGGLAWSREGNYIYFTGSIQDQKGIFRVRTSERRVEPVASLKGIRLASDWITLTPDNSPVVLRDAGTREIYALDWEAQGKLHATSGGR
jgi:hypothetical protein